ncbi:Hypothetical protein NTJ_01672 [Nesidiocoris tenuis]|uniref:Uncharacterized protein n=1 Tax=Nesidiocoris tenuis TaxID=355587 RepID=A0ABN7AC05_9HEMI|nr:Hypothetical protein NTJ_01672 [Nesidiocoris tenuis]
MNGRPAGEANGTRGPHSSSRVLLAPRNVTYGGPRPPPHAALGGPLPFPRPTAAHRRAQGRRSYSYAAQKMGKYNRKLEGRKN